MLGHSSHSYPSYDGGGYDSGHGGAFSTGPGAAAVQPVVAAVGLQPSGDLGFSSQSPRSLDEMGGLFSPRPARQRQPLAPPASPRIAEDEGDDDEAARRFFEATTGGSVEAAPEVLLSDRPRQFDLSGAGDDWPVGFPGGAPGSPSPHKGKGGKLGRLKRSASISVVENLMHRAGK